jgi:sugar-phosphatase
MDGVLVDSRPVVERTWRRWAARHNLSADAMLKIAHGRRTRDTLRILAPELATDSEVAWLDAAELETVEGILPVPGAAALLASLPPSRWTIVTSAGRALAALRLGVIGIAVPEHAVTAEEIQRGKPAPEGYLLAAERLGARPADCLVIEDAPPGIQAGRAAGAHVVAVETTHPREALAGADFVVPDLRALQVTVTASGLSIVVAADRGVA